MRFLLLIACLLASSSYAQVAGWAACHHTEPLEELTLVRVVLMNGKVQKWDAEIPQPKTKAPGVVVDLTSDTPTSMTYTATGVLLQCTFNMPGDELNAIVHSVELRWDESRYIKIAPGGVPKLAVNIVEQSPGLWLVFVGKRPK